MAELKNRSVKMTIDGNEAAAYISYAFTEVAGIYPITPSSNMAEHVDYWAAKGMKNIFGQTVRVIEMQSEAGAAGTVHGSLQAGALTTTYTASQGLLLMIPNMYKIAGELLPCVLHVSARAVAGHALSIYGDHSDVMACRQTGFAMLASSNAQEVMDLGAVAHMATIEARVPFLHFFDGFRTSHEIQKLDALSFDDLNGIVNHNAIREFRDNALNPEHPVTRGTAQNPDIFFQAKEASNPFYNAVPETVLAYMEKINKLTGRNYKLFDYYGGSDAEHVVISMGSASDTVKGVVDYLNGRGKKLGMVNVHLYRPFSAQHFLGVIPDTCRKICVLDRCKEPGAPGEPMYLDIVTAFSEMGIEMEIYAGRYGLGSKDVTPAQIVAVFDNLAKLAPKNHFTVGIKDDVTHLSLEVGGEIDITPEGTTSCKFWGLGADGTVGANHSSIRIIGNQTDMYAQAYFAYDSKKSGGVTQSHLRFGKEPIRAPYLVKTADFVACHNQSYIDKYDMLRDLKDGGKFLLNCMWNREELDEKLPNSVKRELAVRGIQFYTIDATGIARELGLGNRVNTTLQAAFFKIADIIPIAQAAKFMKDEIVHSYSRFGEKVVKSNHDAVDRGLDGFVHVDVPAEWAEIEPETRDWGGLPAFIADVAYPMNFLYGDNLPVSTFSGIEDGTFPMGTSQFEKRSIAVDIPRWVHEFCIQCNQCSYVCPHATVRPFLMTEEQAKEGGFATLKAVGKDYAGYEYRIQVAPEDCPGCGNCVEVCPAPKGKALVMEPLASQQHEIVNWEYCIDEVGHIDNPGAKESVKGSQFEQPLLEFSGACTGCGETPYCKLITQLFGDRMYIANATGCSSIWGASAPSTPYTVNKHGHGPAWQNSLFEDNAEFGYGIMVGVKQRRELLREKLRKLAACDCSSDGLKEAIADWIAVFDKGEESKAASSVLEEMLLASCDCCGDGLIGEILCDRDIFVKKSVWVFGGDGWAYDIGYGGLDHVLASGEDINILVMDTEVYSNTGGQASKSTPTAATAKFAASGKKVRKKDLGMMAASYGYVYVAQVCMGYDQKHVLDCLLEAERYNGPSIVIAYAPCIAHGIKGGMGQINSHMKRAVEVGYWHCWSYNPELEMKGANPFVLRSKEPSGDFKEFIASEARYTALQSAFPGIADNLFEQAGEDAKARYKSYVKAAGG